MSVPGNFLKIFWTSQFDMQKLMERTARAFRHCKNSTPWCIAGIELNKSFGDLRSPLLGTQALLGTLRFECSCDTSTSHKKQEAKWDRCGGERVVFLLVQLQGMTGHSQLLCWRLPAKRFGIWFVAFLLKWDTWHLERYICTCDTSWARGTEWLSVPKCWRNFPECGQLFVKINSDRFTVGFCFMILYLLAMLFWNSCQLYLHSCRWIVCLQVQTAQNNWNITRYITKIVNWSHSDSRDNLRIFGHRCAVSHDTKP